MINKVNIDKAVKAVNHANSEKVKFEIRQLVKNINGRRLEMVSESIIPRLARIEYDRIVRENPGEYFELIEIIPVQEKCLEFTTIEAKGDES